MIEIILYICILLNLICCYKATKIKIEMQKHTLKLLQQTRKTIAYNRILEKQLEENQK